MDVDTTYSLGQGFKPSQPLKPNVNFLTELRTKQIAKAIVPEESSAKVEEIDPSHFKKRTVSPRAKNCSPRNKSKFDIHKTNSLSRLNHQNPTLNEVYGAENQSLKTQRPVEDNLLINEVQDVAERGLPGLNNIDEVSPSVWGFCGIC